ncbi:glutamine-rich protein 2-like [Cuculus canorus]|uniref:glutamine-rich protein 2-like n=1 Tax=Cuculus canorus TaxID=55661 RepID=UPI0023AB07BC|nr:glutamine-rich protein 2-like [Cuculus canorus]
MASSASVQSLSQLLDNALLTPQTIKFGDLHSILQIVLQHLGLQNLCLQEVGQSQHSKRPSLATSVEEMKEKMEAQENTSKALLQEITDLKAAQSQMAQQLQKIPGAQLESAVQEMKRELNELQEQQKTSKATLEEMVAKTADQQAQLHELRAAMQNMKQEHAEALAALQSMKQEREQTLAALQSLKQEREQTLAAMESLRQEHGKDENPLKELQATVTHLQREYEYLSSVTGNLQGDWQKEKKYAKVGIQAGHHKGFVPLANLLAALQSSKMPLREVFEGAGEARGAQVPGGDSLDPAAASWAAFCVGRLCSRPCRKLEKDKADKEDVMHEIAEKADKSSLASKVSQDHLEGILEQLREKWEKMESQQVAKEQDLQEMQQRLTEAVDAKLDRQELGPLKQQLARLKTGLEELKEKGTQPDAAAGIKYPQGHCHCLSCDRVLSAPVTGPPVAALPLLPPMPSRVTSHGQKETQQHGQRKGAADYKFPCVPRSSGGLHTITYPLRHKPKPPSGPPPIQYEETALLGRDGRIYRGQRRRQQPVLDGNEGTARPGLCQEPQGVTGFCVMAHAVLLQEKLPKHTSPSH